MSKQRPCILRLSFLPSPNLYPVLFVCERSGVEREVELRGELEREEKWRERNGTEREMKTKEKSIERNEGQSKKKNKHTHHLGSFPEAISFSRSFINSPSPDESLEPGSTSTELRSDKPSTDRESSDIADISSKRPRL